MKVLNYFSKAYYINLDSRVDRKESFEKQIEDLNLKVERFSAITVEPYTTLKWEDANRHFKEGCIKSHLEIVKLAKKQNLDNVLIFEDDCIFSENFIQKATNTCNQLYNKEWDLFYLGCDPNGECIPFSGTKNLRLATKGAYQTHAYAINKRFYNRMLTIDPGNIPNIDIWLLHEKCIALIADELLVRQSDGFSDNFNMNIKFTYDSYNKFVK